MHQDADIIIDLWSRIKPLVAAKERLAAADTIVAVFDDYGMVDGLEDHEEAMDKQLGAAVRSRFGFTEEEDDENEDIY